MAARDSVRCLLGGRRLRLREAWGRGQSGSLPAYMTAHAAHQQGHTTDLTTHLPASICCAAHPQNTHSAAHPSASTTHVMDRELCLTVPFPPPPVRVLPPCPYCAPPLLRDPTGQPLLPLPLKQSPPPSPLPAGQPAAVPGVVSPPRPPILVAVLPPPLSPLLASELQSLAQSLHHAHLSWSLSSPPHSPPCRPASCCPWRSLSTTPTYPGRCPPPASAPATLRPSSV